MTMEASPRKFLLMRDIPAYIWLSGVVVVALAPPFVPAPGWLMVHLLLLGAATHAILVWTRRLVDAFQHTSPSPRSRRAQSVRLLLLNVGVALVAVGVSAGFWPVTVTGAGVIAGAVVWHVLSMVLQMRKGIPAKFRAPVHFFVAAACLLPAGAALGVMLARGVSESVHARLMLAHVVVNVLGWMGLAMVGTLVMLWPTTRGAGSAEGIERVIRRVLPLLVIAVLVASVGGLAGELLTVEIGLIGYLAGLALAAGTLLIARGWPAASYPIWSVLAGLAWLAVVVANLAVRVATGSSLLVIHQRLDSATPLLAVGVGAQVLFGALSYLVPVAIGGGPGPVAAASKVLETGGALRLVLVNGGVLVCALPVPGAVRMLGSALLLAGLAAFVPLLLVAIRAARRAKATPSATSPGGRVGVRMPVRAERAPAQVAGQVAAGLAALALAVAVGLALPPAALAGGGLIPVSAATVTPTGQTTHVSVTAASMRFTPSTIRVPVGNQLVIDLRNTDEQVVHDLVLDSGVSSRLLSPGESAQIDVGVVEHDLEGWCSVAGHRQMGMVLHVQVTGASGSAMSGGDNMPGMTAPGSAAGPGTQPSGNAANDLNLLGDPGSDFKAHDATLPSLGDGKVHSSTFTVSEVERGVAPGVTQRRWTYNGNAPGPVLHGKVGDTFEVKLVNDGTIGHSIDFHAGSLAPDDSMRTIPPGGSLVYRFTADRAGIWMYHCSSMPMSTHIANGLFGAVVIEPPDLPPVDHSYVLVQSELYLGPQGGTANVDKVNAERPDLVVFNGYANQYNYQPLTARVGQRVRIWVLDAGPSRSTSFHVVGSQFDTVYSEGAYLLDGGDGGSQALALAPGQGGFVELTFPEPGHYPFVTHVMVDAERGAHGLFDVTD